MHRDPFAEITSGQKLRGLPHPPWNQMLRGLKRLAQPAGDGLRESCVEIRVQNATQNPINQFGILQITSPIVTYSQDQDTFLNRDWMAGTTPSAGAPFAITLKPLSPGEIGPARILGLCRAKVNITDTTHNFADATSDTTRLTSGTTGPARILWTDPMVAGAAEKWCVVELLGVSQGGAQLIGTYQFTNQTVNAGNTFTWSTGLQATAAGLYLVTLTINAGSASAGAIASFQMRRTGSASSSGFWPYTFFEIVDTANTSQVGGIASTLSVSASDLVSGAFGVDLFVQVTGFQMFIGGTAGAGAALIRLA